MGNLSVLRDAVFKVILQKAFKAFPRRVEEILEREGWSTFADFMGAVARSGKVLFQFEGKPKAKTLEEKGPKAALEEAYAKANTDAMHQLLSGAFFGIQEGDVDRELSVKALRPLGIGTWRDMSMATLETAVELYRDTAGGKSPLDTAKEESRLFHELPQNQTVENIVRLTEAFGLPTPGHLIALSEAYWSGELTLEDLDLAVGNPELLTELVQRSPSNVDKDIVFSAVDR
jgi:hypothetical protein